MEKQFTFDELHAIIATLRSEHGCPWDKVQTHETLKGNMIEEAYEVNQAISDLTTTGDPSNLREELGDILLQVMLHSQIAEEYGEFTLEDVIDTIARKMIHRHPHVFGDKTYKDLEEQQKDWDSIKATESGHQFENSVEELMNVPSAFPALIRSQKVMKKAYKHDLISDDNEKLFKDMLQSVVDLQVSCAKSLDPAILSEQMGKALLSFAKIAAKYKINAEMSLNEQIEQFLKDIQANPS